MHPRKWLAGSACAGLSLVAASSHLACNQTATWGSTNVACRPLTVTSANRPQAWRGTVFTIVMENQSQEDILDGDGPAYIRSLAAQGAVAANYHDTFVHPSEPNYLWMVAGENFRIISDDDPSGANTIDATAHLADQVERAGLTWKAYEEGMGDPCGLASHDLYAAKHDPFVYFTDVNGWDGTEFAPGARCAQHVVDYSELAADLASGQVPDYVFITPNLVHDMHDGSIADGDAWLSTEVPKILSSDAFKKGGALFLTWDEGAHGADDPPFVVVSPNVTPGTVSQTAYDTSSFLLTVQKMLGVDALPCSADPAAVQSMDDLFAAPL
jgi:acid phosphatase